MKQRKKIENEKRQAAKDALWEAAGKWPSDFFTRETGVVFSGDSISVGHLANLDSRGEGPKGAFYQGRRRIYPKNNFIEFLISRLKV